MHSQLARAVGIDERARRNRQRPATPVADLDKLPSMTLVPVPLTDILPVPLLPSPMVNELAFSSAAAAAEKLPTPLLPMLTCVAGEIQRLRDRIGISGKKFVGKLHSPRST